MKSVPFQFKANLPTTKNPLQKERAAVAKFCREKDLSFKWNERMSRTQGHCMIDGRQVIIKTSNVLETKGSVIFSVSTTDRVELAIKENWFFLMMNPDTGTMILYNGEQFSFGFADRKFQAGKFGEYFFLDLPQEAVEFSVGEDVPDDVIEF